MAKQNAEDFYFFWKGDFSQWDRRPIVIGDMIYANCEHWMMAEKARLFKDDITLEKILKETHPRKIKALGREVQGWNQHDWDAVKEAVVYRGNYAKFTQYPELEERLLATGDKIIVEASPEDGIWGIAMAEDDPDILDPDKWRGINLLGKAIMRVRETLKEEQNA